MVRLPIFGLASLLGLVACADSGSDDGGLDEASSSESGEDGGTDTGTSETGTSETGTSETGTSETGTSETDTGETTDTGGPDDPLIDAAIYQLDFDEDVGPTFDTTWGELDISYASVPEQPVLYLNLVFGGEWAVRNVPVRSGPAGEVYELSVAFDLGVSDGTAIVDPVAWGASLSEAPVGAPPDPDDESTPGDRGVVIRSGFADEWTSYTTIDDPIWFFYEDIAEAAFHPWSKIVNQEVGLYECFAGGISNSLKLLRGLHPEEMSMATDELIDIGPVKEQTGWIAPKELLGETQPGGAPGGMVDDPMTGWNRKKAWCDEEPALPISTQIINDKDDVHLIMEAIGNGCDVEFVGLHVVMVTGVIIRGDGTYVFEVVDDSKQGEAGGLRTSLIEYDPSTCLFSGQEWIQGEEFKQGEENLRPLFMIECVTQ